MNIRPYSSTDFPAVVTAMHRFQAYLADLDPQGYTRSGKDFNAEKYTGICLEKAQQEGGLFLVAEERDEIVGFIVAALRKPVIKDDEDEFPRKKGDILELFVDENYRGQKLGFTLMQKAEEHLKNLGCTLLVVDCFAPNTLAHHFYQRYGFNDRLITMSKPLE